jgi:pSer/pThr/pTyr-binding forkhead associated (FHA) protein
LAQDGGLAVVDADSSNGTYLNRNDNWIRIKRVSLCVGDTIRFGEYEISLQQLTAAFGKQADISLGAKHFSLRQGKKTAGAEADWQQTGAALQKPRRNPLTGKIEDNR